MKIFYRVVELEKELFIENNRVIIDSIIGQFSTYEEAEEYIKSLDCKGVYQINKVWVINSEDEE